MRMRLLAEIIIVGALIYFGWNTPFSEWCNRANTSIQSHLRPKRQTGPGLMIIMIPTAPTRSLGEDRLSGVRS
jgi:hypothetical protein